MSLMLKQQLYPKLAEKARRATLPSASVVQSGFKKSSDRGGKKQNGESHSAQTMPCGDSETSSMIVFQQPTTCCPGQRIVRTMMTTATQAGAFVGVFVVRNVRGCGEGGRGHGRYILPGVRRFPCLHAILCSGNSERGEER